MQDIFINVKVELKGIAITNLLDNQVITHMFDFILEFNQVHIAGNAHAEELGKCNNGMFDILVSIVFT
jgi:hypothetical protein